MKRTIVSLFILNIILFTSFAGSASVKVNNTVNVKNNQIFVMTFTAKSGETLQCNYTVTDGGAVDFIVMNQTNFNIYNNGWITKNTANFSYWSQLSAINTTHAFLTIKLTVSGTYYLVIENSNYFVGGAFTEGPVTIAVSIQNPSSTPSFGIESIIPLIFVSFVLLVLRKQKILIKKR